MTTPKQLLLLAFMLLASVRNVQGQCTPLAFNPGSLLHTDITYTMVLNIKTHFCAAGDGITNDQPAFDAATDFIKKRGGYCKLIIPNGVYRAGRQDAGHRGWYQWPVGVLRLDSVRNVEVAGQGSAEIRVRDGLKYGFFDPATGSPVNVPYSYPDTIRPYAAGIGDIIRINIAEQISVHDLILDGNLYPGKMIIGGHDPVRANFTGIQEHYSGVAVYYSRGVTLNNVTARRFGLDGFSIMDYKTGYILPKTGRIYMSNCKSDFNGRQGASFVWGDSIFVSKCAFTNTGMGEITYSGLQAGIDIEPEEAGTIAENFFFDSCLFENNRNGNIAITSGLGRARNIYFTNCKSYNIGRNGNELPPASTSFNNVALDLGRHQNVNFTNCEFKGYVFLSRSSATSAAEGYKFKRCLFSDCYQRRVNWTTRQGPFYTLNCALVRQPIENISTPLIFAPWTADGNNRWEYVTIDSSVFDVYDRRPWLSIQATYDKPSSIKNSTIYINNLYVPGSTGTTVLSDNQVMIDNNTIFLHKGQSYVHDGVTISGPGTGNTNWGSVRFYRWSYVPPYLLPKTCIDTVMVDCGVITPHYTGKQAAADNTETGLTGYIVYPNPAMERRFELKNQDGGELYYEFLTMNGSVVEKGLLQAYTVKAFYFPELSTGIYYLKIVQDNHVKVEKVILN